MTERLVFKLLPGTVNDMQDAGFSAGEWGGVAPTIFGSSGVAETTFCTDMAYCTANNTLYALSGDGTTNPPGQVYTVNLNTGVWSTLGGTVVGTSFCGIAFDSAMGILRGTGFVGLGGGEIFEIDKGTGMISNCMTITGGPWNATHFPAALAYDSSQSKLYSLVNDVQGGTLELWEVNNLAMPQIWSLVGTISGVTRPDLAALEYDPVRNKLYGVNSLSGGTGQRDIYDVNRATAAYSNARSLVSSASAQNDLVALAYIPGRVICVAEGASVFCADTQSTKPIEQLHGGDTLLDHAGRPVTLSYAVRLTTPTCDFIQIEPGTLGKSVPKRDLLICRGHPLLVDGREIPAEDLLGRYEGVSEVKLPEARTIYTLITERKQFVMIEGIPVATWSRAAWAHHCSELPTLQFTRQ